MNWERCRSYFSFAFILHPSSFILSTLALVLISGVAWAHEEAWDPDPMGPDTVSQFSVFCHSPQGKGRFGHRWLIRLDVYNRRHVSIWYLVRLRGEKPMPNGTYLNFEIPARPSEFGCKVFDGRGKHGWGRLVLLEIPCVEGPFLAFRLPAGGYLEMADFEVQAPDLPASFEAWEASSMTVNDVRSLDDWLPFDSLSGLRVRLPSGTPGSDAASVRRWKIDRLAVGAEIWPVRKITVNILRHWLLPLRPPPR